MKEYILFVVMENVGYSFGYEWVTENIPIAAFYTLQEAEKYIEGKKENKESFTIKSVILYDKNLYRIGE